MLLTVDQAKAALASIIERYPDNVNPTDGIICLYQKTDDDGSVRRCIMGQMGHELSWPEPAPDGGALWELFTVACDENEYYYEHSGPWAGLATEECENYLFEIQRIADGVPLFSIADMPNPTRWGDVKL